MTYAFQNSIQAVNLSVTAYVIVQSVHPTSPHTSQHNTQIASLVGSTSVLGTLGRFLRSSTMHDRLPRAPLRILRCYRSGPNTRRVLASNLVEVHSGV